MIIRYLQIALFIFSITVLFSCEKTAENIEVPDYTAKLVLHGFISPSDSVINVHVSTTKNIYGTLIDYPKILPVKLTLIDGENSLPFMDRDSTGICSLKYRISAGKTYTIVAKCPGYPDVIGTCSVPESENIAITMDTSILHYSDQWGSYSQTRIRAQFQDTPDRSDYYNIYGYVTYTNRYGTTNNPLHFENRNNEGYSGNLLFSDKSLDGETLIMNFIDGNYYDITDTTIVTLEYKVYILKTDFDYYQYHISLSKYQDSSNPFTEFSPVYSNLKGGFGIFCSFIEYVQSYKVK